MKGLFREHITKRYKRSKNWRKVRKVIIVRDNKECKACGKKWGLQVHHILPLHLFPHLELVHSNLITLCGKCHFLIGHLGSWKSWNREVIEMAQMLYEKIKNRP